MLLHKITEEQLVKFSSGEGFVTKDELMLPRLDYSFATVGLVWPQLDYSVATVGLVLPRLGWCCCGWTGVATVGLVLPWLD